MMRYMLLVYTSEEGAERMKPEEYGQVGATHMQLMKEATEKGILQSAAPLQPTRTATTVRTQNGRPLVVDGPFAETKEQLAGYYILECANLDEAIEWAARIPTTCGGAEGCVEIRPLR